MNFAGLEFQNFQEFRGADITIKDVQIHKWGTNAAKSLELPGFRITVRIVGYGGSDQFMLLRNQDRQYSAMRTEKLDDMARRDLPSCHTVSAALRTVFDVTFVHTSPSPVLRSMSVGPLNSDTATHHSSGVVRNAIRFCE
jgi:hypothetical protein